MKCSAWIVAAAVCATATPRWFASIARAADQPSPNSAAIETGLNASLHGRQLFTPDDPWNRDISKDRVDPNSDALIEGIGLNRSLHPDFGASLGGHPFGIPYVVVSGQQRRVPVWFRYATESNRGRYPIPPDAPIEGGPDSDGDRHVIVLDKDNWMLYELWSSKEEPGGQNWDAGSGAIFDLHRGSVQRPVGWTSADAAGLPVFAGLARYDEVVQQGKLTHALRFTVRRTRAAYIWPATHFASRSHDDRLPPMGMRVRLKADFDISRFPPTAQVILQGLKTYGMILADNGGDWFISGTADSRWNDDELSTLKRVRGSDLEVVQMGRPGTKGE